MKLKKAVGFALIAYVVGFAGIVSIGLAVGDGSGQMALNEGNTISDGTALGGIDGSDVSPNESTPGEEPGAEGASSDTPTSNSPDNGNPGGSSSGNGSSGTGRSASGSTGGGSGSSSGGDSTGGGNGGGTTTPAPAPAPAPKPTPAPTPAPSCGTGGTCTAAQVATHNSQSNCWVIYSGKVYNVTGFVSKHPGGRSVFNSNTCGKDISAYLNGSREPTSGEQHRHSASDIRDINPYFIANLG